LKKQIIIPEGMTLSAGLTHYQKMKECQTESLALLRPADPAPETGHFCIIDFFQKYIFDACDSGQQKGSRRLLKEV